MKNPPARNRLIATYSVLFVAIATFLVVSVSVHAQGSQEEDVTDPGFVRRILQIIFNSAGSAPIEDDYEANQDCIDTSITGGNSGADQGGGNLPAADVDLAVYGLETPPQSLVDRYYSMLQGNTAYWAGRLIRSEKLLKSKGMNVKSYLTTAWMWFEHNDKPNFNPYAINCNDNRSGFFSEVSFFCNVNNFQIAGYQAAARGKSSTSINYKTVFEKCYGNESQLVPVMRDVIANSQRVSQPRYSYTSGTQQGKGLMGSYFDGFANATMQDIAPNSDFFNQRTQFYTLILGKDPCMAIGLNSAAVSDGDLVGKLRSQACTYGYICREEKQVLSAMVLALKKFDEGGGANGAEPTGSVSGTPSPGITNDPINTGSPAPTEANQPTPRPTCAPGQTSGGGGDRPPTGAGNLDNYVHYCQCDPKWKQGQPDDAICQAGCGLNTIASGMTTLGRTTTPPELRSLFEGKYWYPNQGMNTTYNALISSKDPDRPPGWFERQGFTPVMEDMVSGGKLDTARAQRFFEGENKNRCFLVGSNSSINHIIAVSGINEDGTITVHDSWLGCEGSGVGPEKVGYRRQNPSYINHYAYPLCLTDPPEQSSSPAPTNSSNAQ